MRSEYYQDKSVEVGFSLASELNDGNGAAQKRTPAFDKLFALSVLVIVFPVLAVWWALILLGGQSPIFLQERIGLAGRPFQIFKFRTIPDGGWGKAERAAGSSRMSGLRLTLFKKISSVLRSTGLDELPQFANVLKGDMQIIGPRPLVIDDFTALPEGRMERCAVPPGITGFAQINGGQDLDSASKLALDIYVIDHLSFGMTARIVWRTIVRIVRGTAATANANARDLSRAQEYLASRSQSRTRATRIALECAVPHPAAPRRKMVRITENGPHLWRDHANPSVRPH